tara:strand:+ start:350 stop:1597 length:1248 start_codon:yes stop_codon:yes gene_type:complete
VSPKKSNLEVRLKQRIQNLGRITFAEFMEACLYDQDFGYYNTGHETIGTTGDYYTAPATHPGFGATLALQLKTMWKLLGSPNNFTVVEGGGHKGRLAKDILNYLSTTNDTFISSINYWIVENNRRALIDIKLFVSEDNDYELSWENNTKIPTIQTGVFISNELFDAYPRHRLQSFPNQLQEIYVSLNNMSFVETIDIPSSAQLTQHFENLQIDLPNGAKVEVDTQGPLFMERIGKAIGKGFVITIDYGYPAETLYSRKYMNGTLFCYYQHTSSTNPYIRVGKQDITAHVDFSSLANAGERQGLKVESLMTQQKYLKKLGIQAFIDSLRETNLPEKQIMENRMALLELTKPTGFGGFGVLIQSKGLETPISIDEIVISEARGGLGKLPGVLLSKDHVPIFRGKYPQYETLDLWPIS